VHIPRPHISLERAPFMVGARLSYVRRALQLADRNNRGVDR
jgi:hypothetical protein